MLDIRIEKKKCLCHTMTKKGTVTFGEIPTIYFLYICAMN